jgi:hypothetical protein
MVKRVTTYETLSDDPAARKEKWVTWRDVARYLADGWQYPTWSYTECLGPRPVLLVKRVQVTEPE